MKKLSWLVLFLTIEVHANDDYLNLGLVSSAKFYKPAYQGAFVKGIVPIDVQSNDSALLSEGRFLDTKFRVRLSESTSHTDMGLKTVSSDLKLLELSKTLPLNEQWVATMGKTSLNWDVGYGLQPVGFFQHENTLYDGQEIEGRMEGIPLAAVTLIDSQFSVTLAYSAGRQGQANHDQERWGLNFGWSQGVLASSVIVHEPVGSSTGLGGTLSWTASDHTVAYASAYSDGRLKAVIGMTYAATPSTGITAEWNYNGDALSSDEWELSRSSIDESRKLYEQLPNMMTSSRLLSNIYHFNSIVYGRHKVFVQWRQQNENWSYSSNFHLSNDGSLSISVNVAIKIGDHVSLEGSWSHLTGLSDSYFAYLPQRDSARLSMRVIF